MNLQDPALTFSFALAAGVLAQAAARHLRIPGIVLLLATGIVLGPEVLGLVRPEVLGEGLHPMVGLAVAVILFEGGLQLNLGRLRRDAVVIRRLITVGALVTITGATIAAMLILGWIFNVAVLFGTLVSVTGPTVINPLTRRIGIRRNLRTILEAEGVLIDPVGAILAVVALELVLATTTGDAAAGLLGFPGRLGLGAVIGVAGGFTIAGLLRLPRLVPAGFENITTLALVLALFQTSNAILPESGIMTVALAGLVVGNMSSRGARELAEFKEQLTILLVGFLFVLLTAAVRIEDVRALGRAGVFVVLVLMFVVRPANVLVSTWGTDYTAREKAFIAWLGPRGIVAFAVSSLFAAELAHADMGAEGIRLRAMVFLVIAATVVVQGGGAGLVARALGVRMRRNHGFLIAGANPVACALAATHPVEPGVVAEQVHEADADVLFGRGLDFERWAHSFRHQRVAIEGWRCPRGTGGKVGIVLPFSEADGAVLVLARRRRADHAALRTRGLGARGYMTIAALAIHAHAVRPCERSRGCRHRALSMASSPRQIHA